MFEYQSSINHVNFVLMIDSDLLPRQQRDRILYQAIAVYLGENYDHDHLVM